MQVRKGFLIGLILLACFLSYFNTLSAGFVWDDLVLVVQNPYVKSAQFLPDFFTHDIWKVGVSTSNSGYYRPLLAASFMADYAIWKDNPFGFHLTNLIFHMLICVLIFCFLEMLIKNRFVSVVSALLFSAHPIHAESVSFISGRVDLIAFFFMMISLALYYKDRQEPRRIYYFISCFCFFLALLNKEMAVTLPLIMISLDYFFVSKEGWKGVRKGFLRRYAGFFTAVVIYLVLRSLFLDWSSITSKSGFYSNFMPGSGILWRVFTAAKIFAMYVRMLIFPYAQSADYFFAPANSFFEPLVLAGIGSVVLLIWLIVKNAKNNPVFSFSCSWFLITLLPVINLIPQGNVFAERYLYIPSLGFCLSMGLFFSWLLNKNIKTSLLNWKKSVYLLLILYVMAFARVCYERNKVWESDLVLWFETAKASPGSARAHMNLASAFYGAGVLDKAMEEIGVALKISPDSYSGLNILGQILQKQGNWDQAINVFRWAISKYPDQAQVYNGLAESLAQKGLYLEAVSAGRMALKINPYFDLARFTLALNYSRSGQFDQAIKEFKQYLAVNPDSSEAYMEMGEAYYKQGEFEKAQDQWKRVLENNPAYQPAQDALRRYQK